MHDWCADGQSVEYASDVLRLAGWTDLSSVAVIVSQHATKAFAALDLAVELNDVITGLDQSTTQGLVIGLPVVVIQIGSHSPTE